MPERVTNHPSSLDFPGQAAILKVSGPPGSGKTRQLAREACRMVAEEGIMPEKILILGLTGLNTCRLRQALAAEARLAGLDSASADRIPVQTMDRFLLDCLQQLVEHPSLALLQDEDARILLSEMLERLIPDTHPLAFARSRLSLSRAFLGEIRRFQMQGVTPEHLEVLVHSQKQANTLALESHLALLTQVYADFQRRTEAAGLLGYAALVSRCVESFQTDMDALAAITSKFSVLMVDEAQDLSAKHHSLLAMLPLRLVLAGNEKLSIRSFRAAAPEAFAMLGVQEGLYGDRPVTHLPLLSCMRHNEPLLALANRLLPEPVWESHVPEWDRLPEMAGCVSLPSPEQEAAAVASTIQAFVTEKTADKPARQWRDCMILLRSTHYQPFLIQALLYHNIPFWTETVNEPILHFQHSIYDLLQVLAFLQQANITFLNPTDALPLKDNLIAWPCSISEKLRLVRQCDRHLMRWLDSSLSENEKAGLQTLSVAIPAEDFELSSSLLLRVLDTEASPAIQRAMTQIAAIYADYHENDSPESLVLAIATVLHADHALNSGLDQGSSEVDTALTTFLGNLQRVNAHYQGLFGRSMSIRTLLDYYISLWKSEYSRDSFKPKNVVRILSLHQAQGEEAALVCVPFLQDTELPHRRENLHLLAEMESRHLGLPYDKGLDEAEEARLLAVGLSRATQQLMLSCHEANAQTSTLPSPFYQLVADTLSEAAAIVRPAEADGTQASLPIEAEDDFFTRYSGRSTWASLAPQSPETFYEPQETLRLSASSLKTYMTCPRQFYYRHLLKLPQPASDAATLGILTHRLLEVFNRQARPGYYTAECLQRLLERMFLFERAPDDFADAGFTERDAYQLARLSPLALDSLRRRLEASVADLARKGYFERYGCLKSVEAEKRLDAFTVEGLKNCEFSGVMDAVFELADGRVEIVDYKTFKSAYKTGLDTCDKHFSATLAPLPDGEDLPHALRFREKLRRDYPKDYQLPLYYWACSGNSQYKGHIRGVSLQIVRPEMPDNERQGAIRLSLPSDAIEQAQEQIVSDLRRYIVEPIRSSDRFDPIPEPETCRSCAYFGICEVGERSGNDEHGGLAGA